MNFVLKNRKSVILGFFVFIGILLLIIGVIILGNKNSVFSKTCNITTIFKNVQGLQKGDKILFLGVKIGTVKDINFIPNTEVLVNMQIDKKFINYIHINSKVRISSDGIIGNKILIIEDSKDYNKLISIQNNDFINSIDNIDTDYILQTFQNNNSNILTITNDLRKITQNILDDNNVINLLLKDTNLVKEISSIIHNVYLFSEQSDITVNQISNLLFNCNTLIKSLDIIFNNEILIENTNNISSRIANIAYNISLLVLNVESISEKINHNIDNIINNSSLKKEIKNIISNLEKSSIILNENLEVVQNKFLFKHYIKKK